MTKKSFQRLSDHAINKMVNQEYQDITNYIPSYQQNLPEDLSPKKQELYWKAVHKAYENPTLRGRRGKELVYVDRYGITRTIVRKDDEYSFIDFIEYTGLPEDETFKKMDASVWKMRKEASAKGRVYPFENSGGITWVGTGGRSNTSDGSAQETYDYWMSRPEFRAVQRVCEKLFGSSMPDTVSNYGSVYYQDRKRGGNVGFSTHKGSSNNWYIVINYDKVEKILRNEEITDKDRAFDSYILSIYRKQYLRKRQRAN